jgi:transposase-like protein
MAAGHRHRTHRRVSVGEALSRALDGFLAEPDAVCPKCQASSVEYYDPYFFSPWRTLTNRRRLKCRTCGFVWRRSRSATRIGLLG